MICEKFIQALLISGIGRWWGSENLAMAVIVVLCTQEKLIKDRLGKRDFSYIRHEPYYKDLTRPEKESFSFADYHRKEFWRTDVERVIKKDEDKRKARQKVASTHKPESDEYFKSEDWGTVVMVKSFLSMWPREESVLKTWLYLPKFLYITFFLTKFSTLQELLGIWTNEEAWRRHRAAKIREIKYNAYVDLQEKMQRVGCRPNISGAPHINIITRQPIGVGVVPEEPPTYFDDVKKYAHHRLCSAASTRCQSRQNQLQRSWTRNPAH